MLANAALLKTHRKRNEAKCVPLKDAAHVQEMAPSPFESVRKGVSADAEVGRAAALDDFGEQDQTFSGQSLGGEQPGRRGGHRKTMSLPANDLSQGRPVDQPRTSHPGTERSNSLQPHSFHLPRPLFSLPRRSSAVWL